MPVIGLKYADDLPGFDDGDDISINVPLIAGLLSGLGTLFLGLLCAAIWFALVGQGRIRLGGSDPGAFDDSQSFLEEEQHALETMEEGERQQYLLAREFQEQHPPNSVNTDISLSQFMTIQEKGVSAWEFEPDSANCFVEGRTEIEFYSGPCTVQTNLPVPKQNDVYYWEAKIYEMPVDTHVSVGLTTKPYPTFRLPGHHRYSVAYDSDGLRRLNQPFSAPNYGPKLQQGDVVGVGYRPRTGTIFFTRNGKKLEDALHGMRMNLFPSIGADGPCTILVNFGRAGFVYIEANVKKWGLAPAQGSLAPPPPYGAEHDFVLLESGIDRSHAAGEATASGITARDGGDSIALNAHDDHIPSSSNRPAHLQPPPPFDDGAREVDSHASGADSINLSNLAQSSLSGGSGSGRVSPPPSYVSQQSDDEGDAEEDAAAVEAEHQEAAGSNDDAGHGTESNTTSADADSSTYSSTENSTIVGGSATGTTNNTITSVGVEDAGLSETDGLLQEDESS